TLQFFPCFWQADNKSCLTSRPQGYSPPWESCFYHACWGLSQHQACRARSASCLVTRCLCFEEEKEKITVVDNLAAAYCRWVNSSQNTKRK
ncbi:hypothetical protein GOODEAATRI_023432, partial [Goodea atripinnis]